jgi:hypothetical protein
VPVYDVTQDEHILKLHVCFYCFFIIPVLVQNIPTFDPILRSCLNQPSMKDGPEVLTALNSRPLITMCHAMQEHLLATSQLIANEQTTLGQRMKEVRISSVYLMFILRRSTIV